MLDVGAITRVSRCIDRPRGAYKPINRAAGHRTLRQRKRRRPDVERQREIFRLKCRHPHFVERAFPDEIADRRHPLGEQPPHLDQIVRHFKQRRGVRRGVLIY